MAEREGFEPSVPFEYTPLAGERLQPLGHLSKDCQVCPYPWAEEEGFEPPEALTSAVFKTAALNHSATPPVFTMSVDRRLDAPPGAPTDFQQR